ncbi:DUF1871 family protein [Ammoniphilus sp. 3BR4]|uniref:DUF1871 family protein n=1 Tax=Ammoniphilus sp. 3BR4 TaxID=3158265 RepID=UPI003467471D
MRKDRYLKEVEIVTEVINNWNPYSLLPDAPEDEFEPEILKVVGALHRAKTVEDLAEEIRVIFSNTFGSDFDFDECLMVARRIWEQLKSE